MASTPRPASPSSPDLTGVGRRLCVSAAVAIALGLAWALFAAYANLLRHGPPSELFPCGRYLCLSALVSVVTVAVVVALSVPAAAASAGLWRVLGDRSRLLFAASAILAIALIAAGHLKVLPVPRRIHTFLYLALAWSTAGAYLSSSTFQLVFFPLATTPVLLDFVDISDPFAIVLVAMVFVLVASWYARRTAADLATDAMGMVVVACPVFAALVLLRTRSFVAALDLGYLVVVVGLIIGVVGILAASLARRWQGIAASLAAVAVGAIVCAAGAVWAGHPPPVPRALGAASRPNIVLIVWDTVRVHNVGLYNPRHDTTPVLQSLASRGVTFDRCIAPSSWTLPSHASMFTGLWPRTHAASDGGYMTLGREYATIAEVLAHAGYETVALWGNRAFGDPRAGLCRGFQLHVTPPIEAARAAPPMVKLRSWLRPWDQSGEDVVRALRRWLMRRRSSDRPFFLFINFFEAHEPHIAPLDMLPAQAKAAASRLRPWAPISGRLLVEGPGSARERQRLWRLLEQVYDAEIRYVDGLTGEVLEMVAQYTGDQRRTLIIVTSDHGEAFGEHGMATHPTGLWEELVRVPLVISWPGRLPGGRRVGRPVSLVDLFATVAEAAGLSLPSSHGRASYSLLPLCSGRGRWAGKGRPLVCERWPSSRSITLINKHYGYSAPYGRFIPPLFAVYDWPWKYLRGAGQNKELLYNIADDPRETHDLSSAHPDIVRKLSAVLDQWLDTTPNNMPTFADGYEKGPLRR